MTKNELPVECPACGEDMEHHEIECRARALLGGQGRDDGDLCDSAAAVTWSLIGLALLFGGVIGAGLIGLCGGAS